ncbi:MAG: PH domain-containing protein [Anaerolineaceae bacterium]
MDAYLNSILGDREDILMVTRQHWSVLFRYIFVEALLVLAIIGGVTLATVVWAPDFSLGWLYLLLFLPLISLIRDVLVWTNLKFIITNLRVIRLSGVLNKNVTDSSLEKVNDVRMTQSMFGRLFDYGDIEIMTASEVGVDIFRCISDPIHFKIAMLNAKTELEQLQGTRNDPGDQVPDLIGQLDNLRKQGILSEEEFIRKKDELLSRL